eukprot:604143-Prorocentrum_minimum.AAC.1
MGAPVQQIQLQGDWLSDTVYRYQQVHLADQLALPTRMAAMAATRGRSGLGVPCRVARPACCTQL